jgi:hypothetical protein
MLPSLVFATGMFPHSAGWVVDQRPTQLVSPHFPQLVCDGVNRALTLAPFFVILFLKPSSPTPELREGGLRGDTLPTHNTPRN